MRVWACIHGDAFPDIAYVDNATLGKPSRGFEGHECGTGGGKSGLHRRRHSVGNADPGIQFQDRGGLEYHFGNCVAGGADERGADFRPAGFRSATGTHPMLSFAGSTPPLQAVQAVS